MNDGVTTSHYTAYDDAFGVNSIVVSASAVISKNLLNKTIFHLPNHIIILINLPIDTYVTENITVYSVYEIYASSSLRLQNTALSSSSSSTEHQSATMCLIFLANFLKHQRLLNRPHLPRDKTPTHPRTVYTFCHNAATATDHDDGRPLLYYYYVLCN